MGGVKCNSKTRVVLSFQHFDNGKHPTTAPKSWEVADNMDTEKAFDYAVARFKEEFFHRKPEIRKHD